MKYISLMAFGLALSASALTAHADDHLYQAQQHGLTPDSQPFQTNPAGRSGDEAPGQGSPFAGADTHTPSTENETAIDHANVKERSK